MSKKNKKKSNNSNFYPAAFGKVPVEYHLSEEAAAAILAGRSAAEKKIDPQKYLCDTINSDYGLLGTCVKVVIG